MISYYKEEGPGYREQGDMTTFERQSHMQFETTLGNNLHHNLVGYHIVTCLPKGITII